MLVFAELIARLYDWDESRANEKQVTGVDCMDRKVFLWGLPCSCPFIRSINNSHRRVCLDLPCPKATLCLSNIWCILNCRRCFNFNLFYAK